MTKKGFTIIQLVIFLMIAGVISIMATRFVMLTSSSNAIRSYESNAKRYEAIFNYTLKRWGMPFIPANFNTEVSGVPVRTEAAVRTEVFSPSYNSYTTSWYPMTACERYELPYTADVRLRNTDNTTSVYAKDIAYFMVGEGVSGTAMRDSAVYHGYVDGSYGGPLSPREQGALSDFVISRTDGGVVDVYKDSDDYLIPISYGEAMDLVGCDRPERHFRPTLALEKLPTMSIDNLSVNNYYNNNNTLISGGSGSGSANAGYLVEIPVSFNFNTGYSFMPELHCCVESSVTTTAVPVVFASTCSTTCSGDPASWNRVNFVEHGNLQGNYYFDFYIAPDQSTKFSAGTGHTVTAHLYIGRQLDNEGSYRGTLWPLKDRKVYSKTLSFKVVN